MNIAKIGSGKLTEIKIRFEETSEEEFLTVWTNPGKFTARRELELRNLEQENRPIMMLVNYFLAVVEKWDAKCPTPQTQDLSEDQQVMGPAPLTEEFLMDMKVDHLSFMLNKITEAMRPELPSSMITEPI